MSDDKDHNSDSDAPEEFTQEQAKLEHQELKKVQRENKTRIAREKKESRKLKAQKLTPRVSRKKENETFEDIEEPEENSESLANKGFLSKNIINFLAERERQKDRSDSEEEETVEEQSLPRKKKLKTSSNETVVYKEMPPPECLKNSLDFLKKRKAQVPRSSSVIKNSGQAVRLISGGLAKAS